MPVEGWIHPDNGALFTLEKKGKKEASGTRWTVGSAGKSALCSDGGPGLSSQKWLSATCDARSASVGTCMHTNPHVYTLGHFKNHKEKGHLTRAVAWVNAKQLL